MRRKDREITDQTDLDSIISKSQVCRLGLCDGDIPYVVPMNFGYADGCLFFHCAKEGRKLDIIRQNNNVCFEIDMLEDIIKGEKMCNWGARFMSVIGCGKALLITGFEEKKAALDIISRQYSSAQSFEYSNSAIDNILVIKVEIISMTGKKSGY